MKIKLLLFPSLLLLSSAIANAQGVAVNTTGSAADNSAMLDVNSTSQGMLVPRMLSGQRTGISSPATGLLVYQTDAPAGFYYYNGSSWISLSTPTSLPPSGSAGGDLTGSSYPNPTIATGAVTGGKIAGNTITDANVSTTAAIAYSKISGGPTALPPNGSASGDLTGSYPNPTIASGAVTGGKIAGNTITDANVSTTAAIAYSKISGGPTALPPNGAAGGNLGGTYPSPSIASLPAISGASLTNITAANITGTNTLPAGVLPTTVTTQGNTFNAANDLVKLDGTNRLPAVDGSQLTNLPSSGGGTGSSDSFVLYTTVQNPANSATTYYFPPLQWAVAAINTTNQGSVNANTYTIMPYACTIRSITISSRTITASTGANDITTIQVYKNGVYTGMNVSVTNTTTTAGNNQTVTDNAHTFTVAAGDALYYTFSQTNGNPTVDYIIALKGH